MNIIHPPAAGGYNLDDKIRSTGASTVCQLVRIADDRKIRLYPVFVLTVQIDSKGGGIDLAVSPMFLNVCSNGDIQLSGYSLMDSAGRSHVIELSVN